MATNWADDLKDVQAAVDMEAKRTKIAAKFLPVPLDIVQDTTVPSDIISQESKSLKIDDTTTTFYQISVQFKLTEGQYSDQIGGPKRAITLATRATNILSQAEDILTFQGVSGESVKLFEDTVIVKPGRPSPGLLQLKEDLPDEQIITVFPTNEPSSFNKGQNRYGENTFAAVAEGYSRLQKHGHYGPYALVLHDSIYADTYAPLKTTLIMPADRLTPFVTVASNVMFYGTGTLPIVNLKPTGLLVSLGGNTMDLVIKTPPTVKRLSPDQEYPFQVYEEFALRLKDTTAVIRFEFQPNGNSTT